MRNKYIYCSRISEHQYKIFDEIRERIAKDVNLGIIIEIKTYIFVL